MQNDKSKFKNDIKQGLYRQNLVNFYPDQAENKNNKNMLIKQTLQRLFLYNRINN